MSSEFQGKCCVRCKSYLFEEDDVVYCPDCGAPHHRECYNALGHCALEVLHGTDQQYSLQKIEEAKEKATEKEKPVNPSVTKCEMCGEEYEATFAKCPKCGAPDFKKVNEFAQFDFLGGVPADYDLGDGVTAEEAKRFVFSNTHRYIPKFAVLNKKNKFSWNWAAFLFPSGWMFSRKMYKGGIITAVFTILATCLSYPLTLSLYNSGFDSASYTLEAISSIAQKLPEIGIAVVGLAVLGTLFDLGIRIVSALLGDYIYKNYTISTIKIINRQSEDKTADYRKKGGMSLFLFLIGVMFVQYGSMLITIFL